jgi:hypothetical protein
MNVELEICERGCTFMRFKIFRINTEYSIKLYKAANFCNGNVGCSP